MIGYTLWVVTTGGKFLLQEELKSITIMRSASVLSILMKLLVECTFVADPEHISPWDVFIDPRFSFGLCCIFPQQSVRFY